MAAIANNKRYWVKLMKVVRLGKVKLLPLQKHKMSGATLKSIIDKDGDAVATYEPV